VIIWAAAEINMSLAIESKLGSRARRLLPLNEFSSMPARLRPSPTLTTVPQTPEKPSRMEGENLGEDREWSVALRSEWTLGFDLSS
jgi:hypothetical protein